MRKSDRFRQLSDREHGYIVEFIRALVPTARDSGHPMRRLARREISLAMWRWTADAFDTVADVVKQDAYKYNVEFHAASRRAIDAYYSGGASNLRHEHVVPRIKLAKYIIEQDMSESVMMTFLHRFCRAAIVTKEEDRRLLPRGDMPECWTWLEGDIYARYVCSGLRQELRIPQ